MIVVDTSLLVSFLNPHDHNHLKAKAWLQAVPSDTELISPNLALCELAATFARAGYTETSVRKILAVSEKIVSFESTDECLDEAIMAAAKCKTRGADSVFVGLAHQRECQLATLDSEQRQKAQTFVGVVEIL